MPISHYLLHGTLMFLSVYIRFPVILRSNLKNFAICPTFSCLNRKTFQFSFIKFFCPFMLSFSHNIHIFFQYIYCYGNFEKQCKKTAHFVHGKTKCADFCSNLSVIFQTALYCGCFPMYARIPPSTYRICPFTKSDASDARNTAGP